MQRRVPPKILSIQGLCSLLCGLVLLLPSLLRAELYYYRDEKGVLHFTNIPTNHRIWKPSPRPRLVNERLFLEIGLLYGLDPALLKAIARAESNFDPLAVSPKGAQGLMQLMPETASDYYVTNVFDPRENLRGAAAFLKDLFEEFKDLRLVLAAYNAGPERVRRYGGIPPFAETQAYVRRVLRFYSLYKRQKNYKFLSKNP